MLTSRHPILACVVVSLVACERAHGPNADVRVVRNEFGEVGTSPGQFAYPRAIDGDGGSVWVIDKTARVQRFDAESGEMLGWWRMPEWENGKPTGVTVAPGPDGRECVWVPDTHYHRVMIYDAADDGRLVAQFGEYGTGDGQFIFPTDIAVLTDEQGRPERVYVSEYGGNDRVSVFDADFRFLFSFGRHGSAGGGVVFDRPQSIVVDQDRRELIVADACNHRLGRLTYDGELIAWVGGPGAGAGSFQYPYGLERLDDGTVLVAEFGSCRVQRIDPVAGRSLGSWGVPGRGVAELASPWGVCVAGGNVMVLDSGNSRVVRVSPEGWGR